MGKEIFRSDLDPTLEGITNYEGWWVKLDRGRIERQANISSSMGSDFTKRLIMHGFIFSIPVAIALIKACER